MGFIDMGHDDGKRKTKVWGFWELLFSVEWDGLIIGILGIFG